MADSLLTGGKVSVNVSKKETQQWIHEAKGARPSTIRSVEYMCSSKQGVGIYPGSIHKTLKLFATLKYSAKGHAQLHQYVSREYDRKHKF
jgi:hypothetical protein